MMISPEAYYYDLKGNTIDELQTQIRSLKQQMGNLKNRMEKPDREPETMCPSLSTQLSCAREYLIMAKKALAEAGGEYHESAADKRAATFLKQLPYLKRIEFSIGGFFGGYNVYQIEIADGLIHLTGWHQPQETPLPLDERVILLEEEEIRTAEELFDYFRRMHIEEWRHDYDTKRFGYTVCDGTSWGIGFEYSSGHRPWVSCGSNSYPYNFIELLKLFGEKDPEASIEEDEVSELLYCQVKPEGYSRWFYYITDILDILPGDIVVVPFGLDNEEKYGMVISTDYYLDYETPYPVENTKKILRKASDEEALQHFKRSSKKS